MADKARARANDPRSEASKNRDLISRGDYTSTPGGKAVFFILRSLDPFLQYSVLAYGAGTALLHRVGLRTLPPGLPSQTGYSLVDNLGLSPYRLILLAMTIGSALKQDIWVVALSGEPMTVGNATFLSFYNTFMNGLNNYMFLLTATSLTESNLRQPQLIVGGILYTIGIISEFVAEAQRKSFKNDPKNKGKPFTGGLWSFARHVNYGAYTLWRGGYAMAAGGWIYGAIMSSIFFADFATRAVPILNEYCEKRYGADWEQFKRQTKYRMIPGIY
jgi:protein-S-isoprenylcysteine O-methyltransferase Ste14